MLYRFTLDKSSKKHICPSCNKKTFVLYIDFETLEYLDENIGRCDREINCGCHNKPKQYFENNNVSKPIYKRLHNYSKEIIKPVSFIPFVTFKASLQGYEVNNFTKYLIELFGTEITNDLIKKYYIGTSMHYSGANVFWQIDAEHNIRTGKIMQYSPTTGKRTKHFNYVHSILYPSNFNLKQCLFGEHLLKNNTKPIAVVESEKTAIIASVYLPQFIWLAASGVNGLSIEKCETLNRTGQKVFLFSDTSKPKQSEPTTFEKWQKVAKERLKNFNVSDLLEKMASETEKQQGFDLADYLIKFNYKEFVNVKKLNLMGEFEKWLIENPNGGTFKFEKDKFEDEGYENETFKIALNEKA